MAFTDLNDMFNQGYKAVPLMNGGVTAVGTLGAQVLGAKDASELPAGVGGTVPVPTASVRGGVLLGATIAAASAATATADTASSAADVAALLVDHNDLVTKYNALLADAANLRTTLNAVLTQLKAKTIPI